MLDTSKICTLKFMVYSLGVNPLVTSQSHFGWILDSTIIVGQSTPNV